MNEFEDWKTLYELDPWGEYREDVRSARQITATLQPHSRRALDDKKFLLKFERNAESAPVLDADYYRIKSMSVHAMHAAHWDRRQLPN